MYNVEKTKRVYLHDRILLEHESNEYWRLEGENRSLNAFVSGLNWLSTTLYILLSSVWFFSLFWCAHDNVIACVHCFIFEFDFPPVPVLTRSEWKTCKSSRLSTIQLEQTYFVCYLFFFFNCLASSPISNLLFHLFFHYTNVLCLVDGPNLEMAVLNRGIRILFLFSSFICKL